MRSELLGGGLLALAQVACGINFPFEQTQLHDADVRNFSAIAFGDTDEVTQSRAPCKAFPGTESWPSGREWSRLNSSLDGALLKPRPAAAVCYQGPLFDPEKCRWLVFNAPRTRFYLDDPLTVLTDWPQGNTCPARMNATGQCTQGGFPEYVVNVSTVRHIQSAVNFARNKNLRLVIK